MGKCLQREQKYIMISNHVTLLLSVCLPYILGFKRYCINKTNNFAWFGASSFELQQTLLFLCSCAVATLPFHLHCFPHSFQLIYSSPVLGFCSFLQFSVVQYDPLTFTMHHPHVQGLNYPANLGSEIQCQNSLRLEIVSFAKFDLLGILKVEIPLTV